MAVEKKMKDNFTLSKLGTIENLYNQYTLLIKERHHKSKDGLFTLEYDSYMGVWTAELPLYCYDSITLYHTNVISILNDAIKHMKKAIKHANEIGDKDD